LHQYDSDFPWFKCRFEDAIGFSQLKQLFDEELELLEVDRMDQWQVAYERINALGLKLIDIRTHEESSFCTFKEPKPGFVTNGRAHNKRLRRTRHERFFIRSCVGEPLKRSAAEPQPRGIGSVP
jgi:hypothetical protein